MSDLRTAAQQALEALERARPLKADYTTLEYLEEAKRKHYAAMAALRAALAQQAEPDAYGYASRLAVAIWEKHYRDIAPQWKPLDDLMGVLTQIDNMAAGMTRLAQQAEPAGTRALIEECLAAFAQELAAWDIDPPLHHVKQAHDKCEAWLAAPSQQAEPQTTHSSECWRWHHKCAVAKIERECKHD